MSRGDRRERIFKDDRDREIFLETLSQAAQKTGWHIHAYCLMNNHFHLVLETPSAKKGDKAKIALAQRLRKETTMSLKWIAQRLQMGSGSYVSNLLASKRPQEK